MRFALNGTEFRGRVPRRRAPPAAFRRGGSLTALDHGDQRGVRARFDRWYAGRRIAALEPLVTASGFSFVDLDGGAGRPASAVSSVTLQGSNGSRHVLAGAGPVAAGQPRRAREPGQDLDGGSRTRPSKVLVGGSTVVHRGQQRFFPANPKMQLRLLLFCGALRPSATPCSASRSAPPCCSSTPTGGVLRQALGAERRR